MPAQPGLAQDLDAARRPAAVIGMRADHEVEHWSAEFESVDGAAKARSLSPTASDSTQQSCAVNSRSIRSLEGAIASVATWNRLGSVASTPDGRRARAVEQCVAPRRCSIGAKVRTRLFVQVRGVGWRIRSGRGESRHRPADERRFACAADASEREGRSGRNDPPCGCALQSSDAERRRSRTLSSEAGRLSAPPSGWISGSSRLILPMDSCAFSHAQDPQAR